MTRMTTTLVLLLLWLTAAGWALSLAPGGELRFAPGGTLVERGQNDTGTGTGASTFAWVNATMTSAVLPSPNVVSESNPAITNAYKGFDHDLGTYFQRNDGSGLGWVLLDCGGAATPTISLMALYQVASNGVTDFTFSGSNNGSAYTTLVTATAADTAASQSWTFASATYRYWKLEWTSVYKPVTKLTQVNEIQLWGTVP